MMVDVVVLFVIDDWMLFEDEMILSDLEYWLLDVDVDMMYA